MSLIRRGKQDGHEHYEVFEGTYRTMQNVFMGQQKGSVALDKTYYGLFRAKGRKREGSGWIGEERAKKNGEKMD